MPRAKKATTQTTTTRPDATTLAGQMVSYFVANLDEQLSIEDISIKFDEPTNVIPDRLLKSVREGWLQIVKSTKGLYEAGPLTHGLRDVKPRPFAPEAAPVAPPKTITPPPPTYPVPVFAPAPKPTAPARPAPVNRGGHAAALPPLNIEALEVTYVGKASRHDNRKGQCKWSPLFLKLCITPMPTDGTVPTIKLDRRYGPALKKSLTTWCKGRPEKLQAHVVDQALLLQRIA